MQFALREIFLSFPHTLTHHPVNCCRRGAVSVCRCTSSTITVAVNSRRGLSLHTMGTWSTHTTITYRLRLQPPGSADGQTDYHLYYNGTPKLVNFPAKAHRILWFYYHETPVIDSILGGALSLLQVHSETRTDCDGGVGNTTNFTKWIRFPLVRTAPARRRAWTGDRFNV